MPSLMWNVRRKLGMNVTSWHFLLSNMCAAHGDENPWTIGEERTLPDARLCGHGYHSSPTPADAAVYAAGWFLCKVETNVVEVEKRAKFPSNPYKSVGTYRKILAGKDVQREFYVWVLEVLQKELDKLAKKAKNDTEFLKSIASVDATLKQLSANFDTRIDIVDRGYRYSYNSGQQALNYNHQIMLCDIKRCMQQTVCEMWSPAVCTYLSVPYTENSIFTRKLFNEGFRKVFEATTLTTPVEESKVKDEVEVTK